MLLKTCWCTPVSRASDLCIVPPNWQRRFAKSGYKSVATKHYEEIEIASKVASNLVSTVVDRDSANNKQITHIFKTKWLSELEIDMCRVLLHSPGRPHSIRLLQMHVAGMRTKLTCVIATKYGDLNTVAKILDGDLEHPCPLFQRAMASELDQKLCLPSRSLLL